jgi:hypothetical protein
MVALPHSAKSGGPIPKETLRAWPSQNPRVLAALDFLFTDGAERASLQDLRIQPLLAAHRNLISAAPFVLPKERFGASEDVPLVPLVRNIVDQTLRAYARTSPYLLEYAGKTPVSPYGSMSLSVSRWGYVDWDYIRDLDWRIFLPPQIGHLSGFKSELERTLASELHQFKLYPLLGGKDEYGRSQVQLQEVGTGAVHGFHFFLIAMRTGFVRGDLHRDGGYSPHYAYFPEGSLDEHLESANMRWSDLIDQQREDYIEMFNQLSFNIFGENAEEDTKQKTRGWYLHKAFKWYASLARVRGLAALEEDLLYQYEHFHGSEAELSYLARYRYYARLAPSRPRMDDLDRDLARVASVIYAQARNPQNRLVGRQVSGDAADILLLETVSEDFAAAAGKLLEQSGFALPDDLQGPQLAQRVRFADNLPASSGVYLQDHSEALIPAEWSLVYAESYVRQVMIKAAEEKRPIAGEDIRQALVVLLASFLRQMIVAKSQG